VTQLTAYFNPSPTADPRTRGSVRRASRFVQISIALINTKKGERMAQACENAWLHQLHPNALLSRQTVPPPHALRYDSIS
jgi:hypothetical protein